MIDIYFRKNIPQVVITIILFSEFITKVYGFHFSDIYVSFSFFIKLLFVVFSFYVAFKDYKNKLSKYLLCLCLYLLLELLIYKGNVKLDFYIYGVRYLYFLLFLIFLKEYNKTSKYKILKFLDRLLLFNSLLIIIGATFDLKVFQTYMGGRLGYNGLINMISDTNYIYSFYILVNLAYPIFNRNKILIILNVLISILVGTKIVIFLAIIYLAKKLFDYNKYYFYVFLNAMVIALVVYKTLAIKFFTTVFKEHIMLYEEYGLLSAVSSTRFSNAINSFKRVFSGEVPITDIIFYNRAFLEYRVEMEFFDLFFFWGILGTILFSLFFYFVNKDFLNRKDLYILITLLLISFLGGKLLTNFTALFIMYSFFTSMPFGFNEQNKHT